MSQTCTRCGADRPLHRFDKDRRRPGERVHICRDCINAADRLRRATPPEVYRAQKELDSFFSHVDVTGPCWLWTGKKNSGGYGTIRRQGRYRVAHRWLWEALVGPVPAGLVLDHLCRVPACVNPDHLEPVTNRENTLRGARPAQMARRFDGMTHCLARGHELTPGDNYQCRECRRIISAEAQARRTARRRAARGEAA